MLDDDEDLKKHKLSGSWDYSVLLCRRGGVYFKVGTSLR